MQEIADAADLAVGTLYNYFRCKPDLLVAIVRRDTEDLVAAGRAILERSRRDPLAGVTELVDSYARALDAHDRTLWRELTCAALSDPTSVGARVFESDLLLIAQIASFLEGLRANGALVPDADCGRLAIAIYAIYFTWLNAYLVNETMSLDELRQEIRYGVGAVLAGARTVAARSAEGSPRPRTVGADD
jgi:AcrR family transcriptional regulator